MRAGAILISKHLQCVGPGGHAVLLTPEPYKCFVLVARELYPDTLRPRRFDEIHTGRRAACAIVAPVLRRSWVETGGVLDTLFRPLGVPVGLRSDSAGPSHGKPAFPMQGSICGG
jgi:hypothetical protein